MLLNEQELQVEIISSLGECKKSLVILSAFIKSSAFDWLSDQIKSKDINVTVVARWRLDDLVSQVSDLEIYKQCQERGWSFKIDQRLHSKLFLIDSDIAYVGSSNLTEAGLGLSKRSNFELSTKTEVTDIDLKKVDRYIDSCVPMTDDLYDKMKDYVSSIDTSKNIPNKWPLSIKTLLEQKVDYLWVDELFFTNPEESNPIESDLQHDLSLLEIQDLTIDRELLEDRFTQTKAIKWLKNQLLKEDSKSLRFGAISKLLHTALLNDPKPYRKEVKSLQSNLFKWIKYLNLSEFKFSKYNYSESISLID
jgi:hypothetical protein